MGGWFPPSLRAGFIAIFRTQPTGDLPVSLLLHCLLLPYCKFLFLGAKKKTRTEVAFLSCLADADAFCFKHRRPVPGVQGCSDIPQGGCFREWCLWRCWCLPHVLATVCDVLLKKDAASCNVYCKSFFFSICLLVFYLSTLIQPVLPVLWHL